MSDKALKSVVQKLDRFAGELDDNEREVLGELLSHAAGVGDASTPLSAAISDAQRAGKTNTRLSLEKAPEGMVLVAKGASAGRLA